MLLQVDLSASPSVAAGRRREPIPIVDPRSGAKVDLPAMNGKLRGPVAIINPTSGERVLP